MLPPIIRQPLTISGAVLGVLLIIFFVLYAEKAKEEMLIPDTPVRVSLSGTYVCLPHVDTSGPQTLECALGLHTDDGKYYALDFALMSQATPNMPMGVHITAEGVFVPIERLSTNHWQKYPIVGIFSVTNSLSIEQ